MDYQIRLFQQSIDNFKGITLRKQSYIFDLNREFYVCDGFSAGVGRTGVFILVDRLLQHIQRNNTINVFATITEMRKCRPLLVQTEVIFHVLLSLFINWITLKR